jgi:hypothetical protein
VQEKFSPLDTFSSFYNLNQQLFEGATLYRFFRSPTSHERFSWALLVGKIARVTLSRFPDYRGPRNKAKEKETENSFSSSTDGGAQRKIGRGGKALVISSSEKEGKKSCDKKEFTAINL